VGSTATISAFTEIHRINTDIIEKIFGQPVLTKQLAKKRKNRQCQTVVDPDD